MPVFSPQSHGSQKERISSGESAESDEEDEIVEKGGRGVEPDEKSEAFNVTHNKLHLFIDFEQPGKQDFFQPWSKDSNSDYTYSYKGTWTRDRRRHSNDPP